MALLPNNVNIVLEDLPSEHRNWLGKLVEPINRFTSSVTDALNKQLSTDNFNEQIKELTFVNNAASFPIKFTATVSGTPKALLKGNVQDISATPVAITAAVDVIWELGQSNQIKITNIVGLTANQKYRLTLIIR